MSFRLGEDLATPSDKVLVPAPAGAEHSFETTVARHAVMAAAHDFDRKNCKQRAVLRARIYMRPRNHSGTPGTGAGSPAMRAVNGVSPTVMGGPYPFGGRLVCRSPATAAPDRIFAMALFFRRRVLPSRVLDVVDTTRRFALTPERG